MKRRNSQNCPNICMTCMRKLVYLDAGEKQKLKEFLTSYADVFSFGDHGLGCTNMVKHHIDTGTYHPTKQAPQRMAPHSRQEMNGIIRGYIKQGVVEKSNSP